MAIVDVFLFFQTTFDVPLLVTPPLARLWQEPLADVIVDVNVPDPPVWVAGVQPVSVPFAVIFWLCAVVVSPGLNVAVPARFLQLLTAAPAGDAKPRTIEPAASAKAKPAR